MIDGGEGIDKSILALVFVYAVPMHASYKSKPPYKTHYPYEGTHNFLSRLLLPLLDPSF